MLFSALLSTLVGAITVTAAPAAEVARGTTPGVQLRSGVGNTVSGFCLGAGSSLFNGTPAMLRSCTVYQRNQKIVFSGSQIQLSGSPACLDVPGDVPYNGAKLQWWTCRAGKPGQVFQYNGTQLKSGSFCVDVTDGGFFDGSPVQLYYCASANNNQRWTFLNV